MTGRSCWSTFLLACLFHLEGSSIWAQQASTPVLIRDVTHACELRWEHARSGLFEWTETKWVAKASLQPAELGGLVNAAAIPPEDMTHTYHNLFEFDGGKYRFERSGPTWNAGEAKYSSTQHVGVWDGRQGIVLRHDMGFPHGELYGRGWDLTQPPLRPLVMSLRPLHPQWSQIDISELVVAERREIIGGVECIAVETSPDALARMEANGRRPWKRTYWMSPQQEFVIVRSTLSLPTLPRPAEDLSITYTLDEQVGWHPSKWKFVEGGSGERPSTIIDATVTRFALNTPPAATRFQFSFPIGAWVRDTRVDDDSFIVREGGGKRPVTKQELLRGSTYRDLLNSETGKGKVR